MNALVVEAEPPDDPPTSPWGRRFELALILGWWTVYGIFNTGQQYAFYRSVDVPMTLLGAARRAFLGPLVWATITLVVFWLARRRPLDRKPRLASIMTYILVGVGFALAEVVISYTVGRAAGWWPPPPEYTFANHLVEGGFLPNLLYFWLLVGVGHGLEYYRRYRARDAQTARLRERLARAELHLLKSQLHPHFLFNTLHTISALMHRDVKAADRMVARLSELLRIALEYTGTQEVSLQEELQFLAPYIEIERTRLGNRLAVDIDVQPNVLDARVPHMLLQPLVENAIRHGIAPRAAGGHITITARGRRGMIDLEVLDDGPGLPPGRTANGGHGLAITRARLEQLYGEDFSFEPRNAPAGGFRVALTIPFHPIASSRTLEESTAP